MPKVLAPGLELLWRAAKLLAQHGQRLAKGVRFKVWQACAAKGVLEDPADRLSVAPVRACEPLRLELLILAYTRAGCREQGIVVPHQLLGP